MCYEFLFVPYKIGDTIFSSLSFLRTKTGIKKTCIVLARDTVGKLMNGHNNDTWLKIGRGNIEKH